MEISAIKNIHIFLKSSLIEWDHPHSERWHLGWWFDDSCATGARRSSVRAGCFQCKSSDFFLLDIHDWNASAQKRSVGSRQSDEEASFQRNGTSWSDGDLLMETGTTDVNHLGRIVTWNGNNRTEAYEGVLPHKTFLSKFHRKMKINFPPSR